MYNNTDSETESYAEVKCRIVASPTVSSLRLTRLKGPFSELVFLADSEHTLSERRTAFFIVDVVYASKRNQTSL